jgi:hypothetical protein
VIKKALQKAPEDHDLIVKLLELNFLRNDRLGFEKVFYDKIETVKKLVGRQLVNVLQMGEQLCPDINFLQVISQHNQQRAKQKGSENDLFDWFSETDSNEHNDGNPVQGFLNDTNFLNKSHRQAGDRP